MKSKEHLLLIACLMVTLCEAGKDAEDLIQQGCVRKKKDYLWSLAKWKDEWSLPNLKNVVKGIA